jgi:hypothetical protein
MCPYYLDGDLVPSDVPTLLTECGSITEDPVIPVFQPPLIDGG